MVRRKKPSPSEKEDETLQTPSLNGVSSPPSLPFALVIQRTENDD